MKNLFKKAALLVCATTTVFASGCSVLEPYQPYGRNRPSFEPPTTRQQAPRGDGRRYSEEMLGASQYGRGSDDPYRQQDAETAQRLYDHFYSNFGPVQNLRIPRILDLDREALVKNYENDPRSEELFSYLGRNEEGGKTLIKIFKNGAFAMNTFNPDGTSLGLFVHPETGGNEGQLRAIRLERGPVAFYQEVFAGHAVGELSLGGRRYIAPPFIDAQTDDALLRQAINNIEIMKLKLEWEQRFAPDSRQYPPRHDHGYRRDREEQYLRNGYMRQRPPRHYNR